MTKEEFDKLQESVITVLTMRVNAVMSQNLLQRHMWQKGSLQANNLKKGAKKNDKRALRKTGHGK